MKTSTKTILLIDDNQDILEAIQLLLEDAGYRVMTSDSAENIDFTDAPDVIFLDMLLSGKDGREILQELKSKESTRHIPVILSSAHPNAKNIWKASGADDFIEKPFDIETLLSLLEKYTT